MEIIEVEQLAMALMDHHGLIDRGWHFHLSRGKTQMGYCSYGKKRISLSKFLIQYNGEAEIRDVILHEIAHALAGPKTGHGPVWKRIAAQIGAAPQRLTKAKSEPRSIQITCGVCQRVLQRRYRRMNSANLRGRYCQLCGPSSIGMLNQSKVIGVTV